MTELSLQGKDKVEVNYTCQLYAPLQHLLGALSSTSNNFPLTFSPLY